MIFKKRGKFNSRYWIFRPIVAFLNWRISRQELAAEKLMQETYFAEEISARKEYIGGVLWQQPWVKPNETQTQKT